MGTTASSHSSPSSSPRESSSGDVRVGTVQEEEEEERMISSSAAVAIDVLQEEEGSHQPRSPWSSTTTDRAGRDNGDADDADADADADVGDDTQPPPCLLFPVDVDLFDDDDDVAAAEEEYNEKDQDLDNDLDCHKKKQPVSSLGSGPPFSEQETSNRASLLEAVRHDAAAEWRHLPPVYRNDKEFILAALQSPELPSKPKFERAFPRWLRFDRDVVLAFASRDDFSDLYYDRHLFVPGTLTSDKQVMLAYCRKIPRSLQDCSDKLTDDEDVVRAAIGLDGLELQYASRRLQERADLVRAACQKDGRALEFCPPGAVRDSLTSDRDFMLSVLRRHGGSMLRLVSEPLTRDRELLLEALSHGMRWRYCPYELQSDRDFLLRAVASQAAVYLQFNAVVQREPDIAAAAVVSETSTTRVHKRALDRLPALAGRADVVRALAARGCLDHFREMVTDPGSPAAVFSGNKDVMLTAVRRRPKLHAICAPPVDRDVDILLAAMDASTAADVIRLVSADMQREHPELAVRAIDVASPRSLRLIRPHIDAELWSDCREVAAAWIRRGGPVLDPFAALLDTDRDFCLLIAKHSWREFSRCGARFLSDRAFMVEAVELDGRVCRYAAASLRRDLDLACRAVAQTAEALSEGGCSRADVETYCRDKLKFHETFVTELLRGMRAAAAPPPQPPRTSLQQHQQRQQQHWPTTPANRSKLAMLDLSVETSQALKKKIAEFAGVPFGAELKRVRAALQNASNPEAASASRSADERELERAFLDIPWLDGVGLEEEAAIPAVAAAHRPVAGGGGIRAAVPFPPGVMRLFHRAMRDGDDNEAPAAAVPAAFAGPHVQRRRMARAVVQNLDDQDGEMEADMERIIFMMR